MIQSLSDIRSLDDDDTGPEVGTGGCGEDATGVWAAWVCLDANDGKPLGLIGYGESEGKACAALKSKCVALASLMGAANEQASANYNAKRAKEAKESVDKLLKALGGGNPYAVDVFSSGKKNEGDN